MSSLMIIIISVAVFLLLREVLCWYFKINARLDVSKKILAELKASNNKGLATNSIKSQG